MRRIVALAAALALVLTMAGSALGATGHFVVGTGWRLTNDNVPTVQFRVAAQIGLARAYGTYQYGSGAGTFTVTLSCGAVDGDTSVVGGLVTTATDPNLVGTSTYLFFVDGGPATFGALGPDSVSLTYVGLEEAGADMPADFPTHCPQARGDSFDLAVTAGLRTVLGDVVVR
jgi:hypothetical protein